MTENEDCIFCKIIKGIIPSSKVFESDAFVAFNDINPAADTHILVVPKVHISDLGACGDTKLLGEFLATANEVAQASNLTDYRIIINKGPGAGQTVFHLHLHILAGRNISARLI